MGLCCAAGVLGRAVSGDGPDVSADDVVTSLYREQTGFQWQVTLPSAMAALEERRAGGAS